MEADVLVLGAGMVGISCALHLQARGRQVVVLDRRGPGEETSFGNAGIVQREAIKPYRFPRAASRILSVLGNRRSDVRYHARALLPLAAPLWRYYHHSATPRWQRISRDYASLIAMSVDTHQQLMDEAQAHALLGPRGWLMLLRSEAGRDEAFAEADLAQEWGVQHRKLDTAALAALEPALQEKMAGAVWWQDPLTVRDPGALVQAYAALFTQRGGTLTLGDATTLTRNKGRWQVVDSQQRVIRAREVVVALGPWSTQLTQGYGYRPPLFVKRGYHQHYRPLDGKTLNHWIMDEERGYLVAPMARGLRITTGAELAGLDAPATPRQLQMVERFARDLVPMGEAVQETVWKGARPCMPDMKPVIGAAPGVEGMWCAFGHGHQGFTLGPATGLLLAQLMTGEKPATDTSPFRADRAF